MIMNFKKIYCQFGSMLFVLLLASCYTISAQDLIFSRLDSLRGSLSPFRSNIDVLFYNLDVEVFPQDSIIVGSVEILFEKITDEKLLQIDAHRNLIIDSIFWKETPLIFVRENDVIWITLPEIELQNKSSIIIYYHGKPTIANNPPWDGGFVWREDAEGNPWIGVACEGIGASIWWPNKDHLSDEPDSCTITCTVPYPLECIANGELRQKNTANNKVKSTWHVSYPINNYNITLNIGKYAHFADTLYRTADNSSLKLDFYPLAYNYEKAQHHFGQIKPMLHCLEHYLGYYPFENDGYALVETPYLGMEHQGAIAWGNEYKPGYLGRDLSQQGYTFDYIMLHETIHEWWGNSVSCADLADLWIHEAFCTYAESFYIECLYGYQKAIEYINGSKYRLLNDVPMRGQYGVNNEGSGDMYVKGALFLNTLRHVVNKDELWWNMIYGLANDYKFQTIHADTIIDYFCQKSAMPLRPIFIQYLDFATVPEFDFYYKNEGKNLVLYYRWKADVADFSMPFWYKNKAEKDWQILQVNADWQKINLGKKAIEDDIVFGYNYFYVK
ncbi:MAG: M1 family metallopeptidase [Chitinophagales bacterium]|nr:M1 family metallopeptidase [Bacteroidota bacterium]MCB9044481.1 M1 family metallopeptidase [Chitinophagales bacterium]